MNKISTGFDGLFIIENKFFNDSRGSFVKLFNCEIFSEKKLNFEIREYYYTISKKNVIRGMHFQKPPYDHDKLVHVSNGSIIDVVVDLRQSSKTFGKYFEILIDSPDKSLFIPKGFSHGFKALENNTLIQYFVSSEYNKIMDTGIHYNSFGYDWNIKNPIISERDLSFDTFIDIKHLFE